MNTLYNPKYELFWRWGTTAVHQWSVSCAFGGIHLHLTHDDNGENIAPGGLEIHRRLPPDGHVGPPGHTDCWLTGGPCWHKGSSLQASEIWYPRWRSNPHDHEGILTALAHRMEEAFEIETQGGG